MRTLAARVQIAAGIATVVLTIATLMLVFLAYRQITHIREQIDTSRQIESVDLMLKFNERLRGERFSKLTSAISDGKPILKQNGGCLTMQIWMTIW
jgi:hypothetical protein